MKIEQLKAGKLTKFCVNLINTSNQTRPKSRKSLKGSVLFMEKISMFAAYEIVSMLP